MTPTHHSERLLQDLDYPDRGSGYIARILSKLFHEAVKARVQSLLLPYPSSIDRLVTISDDAGRRFYHVQKKYYPALFRRSERIAEEQNNNPAVLKTPEGVRYTLDSHEVSTPVAGRLFIFKVVDPSDGPSK